MAYKLRYYKELISQGHQWNLEIYQDTESAFVPVAEIGQVLQSLRLVVQGDQADMDTPIVKTSLEMVFVDAPDLPQEGNFVKKCGNWEEFYTSSATEWKVVLLKDNMPEWSGYITPDSYSESLQYRGSVTIIARDNLGALQDYEYEHTSDSSGMVSLIDIINGGLEVISFPMQMTYSIAGARSLPINLDSDVTDEIQEVLFNNQSFIEKTWLEAVEDAMKASGLVLRYVGGNKFMLSSIRDIPLYDHSYWWDVPVLAAEFCAYGQREMSPAVKTLIDEVSFNIEENFAEMYMPAGAYGDAGTYDIMTDSNNLLEQPLIYPMPIHAVVGGSWTAVPASRSLLLNPFAYPLKDGHSSQRLGNLRDTSAVYVAANNEKGTSSGRSAAWQIKVGPGKYRFSFKVDTPAALYDENTKIGHIDLDMNFSRFVYSLRFISEDKSEVHEYRSSSNTWIDNMVAEPNSEFPGVAFPYVYEFPVLEVGSVGQIQLLITYVGVVKLVNSPDGISKGAYVALREFSLTDANLEETTIPGSQKVTTIYNKRNNILIQRRLNYGFNPGEVASTHIIQNGMFIVKDGWYDSAENWVFSRDSDADAKPLPVLMHQQLLAYYSQPNSVLSGELATKNPLFNALYKWHDKLHLLISGTFNVISGRMENVVLREFMRYDHMWGTKLETDAVEVDSQAHDVELKVLGVSSLKVSNAPIWCVVSVGMDYEQNHVVRLYIEANTGTSSREAILNVNGAFLKVTQLAKGN